MDRYRTMMNARQELSPIELGERLKVARETANVTQDAGAKAAGIARTTLVAIEKGQRSARNDELQALSRC
jgi:DNA-binding XRE family transcriptional regulator